MSQGVPAGRAESASHRPARGGRIRTKLGLATASPWLRAPLLLFRYPGLLLAIATAAGILALAGASSPLFLSAAGNALLQENIGATCPWVAGVQVTAPGPLFGTTFTGRPAVSAFQETTDRLAATARQIPHTGPIEIQAVGTALQASAPGGSKAYSVRLYTRDGGLAHVQKLQDAGGPGLWFPNTIAESLGLRAGDVVRLAGSGRPTTVSVAGVYRDLATLPRAGFWCAQDHLIYPLSGFANYVPPPFVMADRDTFFALGARLRDRGATFTWEIPIVSRGLTIPEARRLDAAIQTATDRLREVVIGFGSTVRVDSSFDFILQKAEATTDSLRSPVWTISLAGRLVALLVIAGSGVYWVHRRRTEVALLSSRGTGPVAVGAKAFLEALPIVAVASVAGWTAGIWLIKSLGPSELFDEGAQAAALRQVAWTAAVGVLLLAVVAGVAARRDTEPAEARGRRSLAGTPWEIAVLALAAAALYEFLTRAPRPTTDVGNPLKVDALVLLFPILFVAGAAGLVARGLRVLLPRLRTTGRAWPASAYLASRRLAIAPRIVLALLTASALSIGILSYAGALTSSIDATADAKARVFTGSDLDVALGADILVPPSIAARTTKVTQVDRASFVSDQLAVEVLGVDPSTFSRAAFWDPSFADRSLGELLQDIASPPSASGPVPVIAAGQPVGRSSGTLTFRFGGIKLPVRIVDQVRAFPSMSPSEPLLVADAKTLADRGVHGVVNLWVKGDPQPALTALTRSNALIISSVTAIDIKSQQSFVSLSWTFGFLQALGIMAGLIVLGGILLYLEARQRGRAISYALASRMGLSRRSHRTSVALELGVLLALGCVVGIGLAWIAARIVYGRLDPLPQLPPAPLFRLPVAVFGLTALAVLAAAWLGAWRVQHEAERARVSEVMRVAG